MACHALCTQHSTFALACGRKDRTTPHPSTFPPPSPHSLPSPHHTIYHTLTVGWRGTWRGFVRDMLLVFLTHIFPLPPYLFVTFTFKNSLMGLGIDRIQSGGNHLASRDIFPLLSPPCTLHFFSLDIFDLVSLINDKLGICLPLSSLIPSSPRLRPANPTRPNLETIPWSSRASGNFSLLPATCHHLSSSSSHHTSHISSSTSTPYLPLPLSPRSRWNRIGMVWRQDCIFVFVSRDPHCTCTHHSWMPPGWIVD